MKGKVSNKLPVVYGIPHGSVLDPTLFTMFTDLPAEVKSGMVYMYADDTTLYCTERQPMRSF